jgi:alkanesulfonate monooxygenase SsuD/methylene tetrahydromethanopterin reductase-like flavin-dependent oxidoreductase (luciferase family)
VTCPSFRYRPAIVAQAFASLGVFYPGRVFLGVGSGEALNELPAGGGWADIHERAERLAEAVQLIRKLWTAFFEGARSAGKVPAQLRILVEAFIVVGGQAEAEEAAQMWRFIPIGFTDFIDEPDPRKIQHGAEQKLSTRDVYSKWVVADDPRQHADFLRELASLGATDIFVHSGQSDQQRVIDFYGREVLPLVRSSQQIPRAA